MLPRVVEADCAEPAEPEDVDEDPSPPEGPHAMVPVVGLGASAGGLAALEEFFSHLPGDVDVAFVVVTHQHPDHPTLLHSLLARKTSLPVSLVEDTTVLAPGHVYVAPPGRALAIMGDRLHVLEHDPKATLHLPIDAFFRSLAAGRKDGAIGIILSGTGADGTLGIKEIKAVLGMVMAQDEASAGYSGMPRSAVETGLVDYVLRPAEMPAQLLAYLREVGRHGTAMTTPSVARVFDGIFLLLRSHTGNDFSQYKLGTIKRRIERRMHMRHVDSVADYLALLRQHPDEAELLFRDLLIGVTSFFRDGEAFGALAERLPDLVERKAPERVIRVWVPGCSTGEEAYSLAILLHECMNQLQRPLEVQIFATDIDASAIERARLGTYPLGIAHHVTPERLARYFTRRDDTFCIKKEIREMVVFAVQNVIADPPFTRLDVLSCRNLLIYLDAPLQRRLLPMFHYALRPGGLLVLGSSESVGGFSSLFEAVDKKWKVYRRSNATDSGYVVERLPSPPTPALLGVPPAAPPALRQAGPLVAPGERLLLQALVPPTVVLTDRGEVLHVHGRTGRFLEPAPGPQQPASIFDMAREGLLLELSAAIRLVGKGDTSETLRRDVRVSTEGGAVLVDLRVKRVRDSERGRDLLLVTFDRARPVTAEPEPEATGAPTDRLGELERELQHSKESHQSTIEELETSNEELRSTNEELQSTNEELQSANEELETSKEEMQSLNEELQTVNAELQGKLEELSRANDDMRNLLNGTDIATVFLDERLNVKRYTEQAKRVIRLIPSDVGRPIGDLVSRLHYDRLVEDADEVLRTLMFKEAEVRARSGGWYLMRILPYRTTENMIDGLVITFVDITKVKQLQQSEARLDRLLLPSPTAILGQDRELRYVWVSGTAFGRSSAASLVGLRDTDLFPAAEAAKLTTLKRMVLETGTPRRARLEIHVDGAPRIYDVFVQPVTSEGDGAGPMVLSCVVTDITNVANGTPAP